MSDKLKNLVEKSRNTVKTEGEIVEGEGREVLEFSDGADLGIFENGNNYAPSKKYSIRSPYDSENFVNKAEDIIERNKNN